VLGGELLRAETVALLITVALGSILAAAIFRQRIPARTAHKRGALVLRARSWRPGGAGRRLPGCELFIGHVAVRPADETKHFKLIGTTGTGKSTALYELLRGALLRGDRAVIADPDTAYLSRFYDSYRGDVILNPFEPHAVTWDVFAEIRSPYDVEELARALIPPHEDATGREWRAYARTFLCAVLRRCHEQGLRNRAELWRLLAVATAEELRPIVFGTPAQPFLEADNSRMFCSIRSVAISAIAALEHVHAQRAVGFSVRSWVEHGRGVLFMPYRAAQISALRSMIATWMRLAIFQVMSAPENADQRIWFVIDELDALGAIDGLKDALARLRKFGGRCVLGFQSVAQVFGTYGDGDAHTIIENCGHTLILRCSGSEHGGTSEFASRLIGEREIVRQQRSQGRDREGLLSVRAPRRSTQVNEQHTTEMAVLASELEQLPDLTGYLKTASSPQWRLIRLDASRARWPSIT